MSQREATILKKQNKPTYKVLLSLPSLPPRGEGCLAGISLFPLFEEQRTEKYFFFKIQFLITPHVPEHCHRSQWDVKHQQFETSVMFMRELRREFN